MIKPGSVPLPATTHLQHPHHQSHQMPVVLKQRNTTILSDAVFPWQAHALKYWQVTMLGRSELLASPKGQREPTG